MSIVPLDFIDLWLANHGGSYDTPHELGFKPDPTCYQNDQLDGKSNWTRLGSIFDIYRRYLTQQQNPGYFGDLTITD